MPPTLLDKANWIWEVTPTDGSALTNRQVQEEVARLHHALSTEEYFEARDFAIVLGLIGRRRGPGGMIYRTHPVQPASPAADPDWNIEQRLYVPFSDYLQLSFSRNAEINIGIDVRVVDVSTYWQARTGRWSVPDLILIARQSYEFFYGYDLDVITFEAKTYKGLGDRPVYQAHAQSASAHSGYLLWHCPDAAARDTELPRLRVDCANTGIGLIVCSDPLKHDTYHIEKVAKRRPTSAAVVDQFLSDRLPPEEGEKIINWLKSGV